MCEPRETFPKVEFQRVKCYLAVTTRGTRERGDGQSADETNKREAPFLKQLAFIRSVLEGSMSLLEVRGVKSRSYEEH